MKTIYVFLGTGIAALLASACCWLPALLGATSAGSLGISGVLSPWRPYLLGLTGLFLVVGFWLVYRKPKTTDKENCCTNPAAERIRKVNIYVMWVVALFSLSMAAYPYIQVVRYRAFHSTQKQEPYAQHQLVLSVAGMDCESCAISIEENFKKVPGVVSVHVDYANKRVLITLGTPRPSEESLIHAVSKSGFKAQIITNS